MVASRNSNNWCRPRDSNSHGFPHRYLKPACLPIPSERQNMYTIACKQVVKFWHSYNAFTGIKHTNSAQVMI